jgi:hypothetical protein
MKIVNWKTDLVGVALLISAAAHWYATGVAPSGDDVVAILAGFGLIAAKDASTP